MEPVQLPQSTSPKTQIWVSQARPCQEQPALFGSLERQARPAKPSHHATPRSHTQAQACPPRDASRVLTFPPVPGPHGGGHGSGLSSPALGPPGQEETPLLFAVLFSDSERRQTKHSCFLLFWARSCENQRKSMFAGFENRSNYFFKHKGSNLQGAPDSRWESKMCGNPIKIGALGDLLLAVSSFSIPLE